MKKLSTITITGLLFLGILYANDGHMTSSQKLPDLKMPDNNLPFTLIDGYQDYRLIATHFRTDKNEIRYILANPIGYNALKEHAKVMPEGSKIVKIGWTVKKMDSYDTALEADAIQRVEYMVKDSKRFNANGDHWGYARFVKKDGAYTAWQQGSQSCISCHSAVKETDYLFTRFQDTF